MTTQIKDSGLQYCPKRGEIVYCDFSGYIAPEIIKKRPVVIINPRLPYRSGLVNVIPLSTTPPLYQTDYVVKLNNYYGVDTDKPQQYAKCDLMATVSLKRLDRFKVGYRKYTTFKMSEDDFTNILYGIKKALGL